MKKVLFYIDTLGRGGAQRVMSNLVTYFHKRGYEVTLVNDYAKKEGEPQYVVPEDVKRVFLRDGRNGNPVLKNLERIRNLRKLLKEERPDLVLSFLGNPNFRMLIASGGLKHKKIVSVRNDPYREYGRKKVKKLLANFVFLLADAVVFQTKDAGDYFWKIIRKKSRIILNPVDATMFADGEAGERKNVVTLGRLQPQKNHKMLIDAFASVAEEFPDEHLIIYGDGPDRKKTEDYIAEVGMQERVLLPGNIADVKSALLQAKLFVLSSDYEGLPNALMEAMATGTPAISTDCPCGGPKTLIQNGEEGILVPVGDVEATSEAMHKMLGDDAFRSQIGENARKRADIFRDEVVYKQWEDYFLELSDK